MTEMKLTECFRMLGLKGTEDISVVKSAYRKQLKQKFPTLDGDSEEARLLIEAFKKIAENFGQDPATFVGEEDPSIKQNISKLLEKKKLLNNYLRSLEDQSGGKSFQEILTDKVCRSLQFYPQAFSPFKIFNEVYNGRAVSAIKTIKKEIEGDESRFTLLLRLVRHYESRIGGDWVTTSAHIVIKDGKGTQELEVDFEKVVKSVPYTMSINTKDEPRKTLLYSIMATILPVWEISVTDFDEAMEVCHQKKLPLQICEIEDRARESALEVETEELEESIKFREDEIKLINAIFPDSTKLIESSAGKSHAKTKNK